MRPARQEKRPVIVKWLDAAEMPDACLADISRRPIADFLIRRTHIGWILKRDRTGIILAHDRQEGEGKVDILAIPTRWILKIEKSA